MIWASVLQVVVVCKKEKERTDKAERHVMKK